MTRVKCILMTAICLAILAPSSNASQADPMQEVAVLGHFELGAGDSEFWTGEYTEQARPTGHVCCVSIFEPTDPVDHCTIPGWSPCFDYELEVLESSARLRIALDVRGPDFGPPTNDETDHYAVWLFRPDGTFSRLGRWTYNLEGFVNDPVAGTWRIRVYPLRVSRSSFVMRARLDEKLPEPPKKGALLPNLRSIPAADFGLTAAAGYYCGFGQACTKAEVAGQSLMSCMAEEQIEDGVQSCLRFSVGSENAGVGPLDLKLSPATDGTNSRVTQIIHFADGSTEEREAGTYEFHKSHAHYHLGAYAKMTLFEVTEEKRKGLVAIGGGKKSGFCLADERIADWEVFATEPTPDVPDEDGIPIEDCISPHRGRMIQNAGWGDVYEYDRSGNYVPFSVTDGDFVLRSTVDAENVFLESNEKDNTSYAWIRVEGGEIELLEHGYGTDPWDPHKVISQR